MYIERAVLNEVQRPRTVRDRATVYIEWAVLNEVQCLRMRGCDVQKLLLEKPTYLFQSQHRSDTAAVVVRFHSPGQLSGTG